MKWILRIGKIAGIVSDREKYSFVAMTSWDAGGNQSAYSNEVLKTVN